MPMLDYKCGHCSTVYEILTDKEEPICTSCKATDQQNIVPPSCGRPIVH